jgi:hypothetical protein
MWWRLFQTLVAIATICAVIYATRDLPEAHENGFGRAIGIIGVAAAFAATLLISGIAAGIRAMSRRARP